VRILIKFMNKILKGSIVSYNNRWMRVTAVFKDSVNLGPIWGGRNGFSGIVKRVPLDQVREDEQAWQHHWESSETYQSM